MDDESLTLGLEYLFQLDGKQRGTVKIEMNTGSSKGIWVRGRPLTLEQIRRKRKLEQERLCRKNPTPTCRNLPPASRNPLPTPPAAQELQQVCTKNDKNDTVNIFLSNIRTCSLLPENGVKTRQSSFPVDGYHEKNYKDCFTADENCFPVDGYHEENYKATKISSQRMENWTMSRRRRR